MARDEARTLRVRCATWDQVDAFLTDKMKGNLLVVKMPMACAAGDGVTVALGLPNGLIFAIDGAVEKLGKVDAGGKHPVQLKMHGLSAAVRERLERMVADGRAGLLSQATELPTEEAREHLDVIPPTVGGAMAPTAGGAMAAGAAEVNTPAPPDQQAAPPVPTPADVPVDEEIEVVPPPRLEDVLEAERPIFVQLEAAREKLLRQHTYEVLAVDRDATLREVRRGYFALTKRFHPDMYGRYRSPAVRQLASEVFIHINKAYDRMREAAVAAGGAVMPGPAWRNAQGWLADLSDFADADEAAPMELVAEEPPVLGTADDGQHFAPAAVPPRQGQEPPPPVDAAGEPPDEVAFESARIKPLTHEDLFGDVKFDAAASSPRPVTATDVDIIAGRAAMEERRWVDARGHLATALRADPRNRQLRALYHVASGMELRERGAGAEAQLQFETALIHDKECAPALQALGRQDDKAGTYRVRR